MKVLFVASEVAPIIKIGGLGDVAGSLPKALEKLGVDVDVIVPFYSLIDESKFSFMKQMEISVPYAGATHEVGVYKTKLPGSEVDAILLRNLEYLSGGGLQAFSNLRNEIERFSFFDRAVVEFIKCSFNVYDLVHCNDWHTGLITHLLEEEVGQERPATLFTIHNIAYQGETSMDLVAEVGLNIALHDVLRWDLDDGNVNFMLEGIASSDAVSTVSKSYANEIMFPDIGGAMADILRGKSGRVFGILNGIDYGVYLGLQSLAQKAEAKLELFSEIGSNPRQGRTLGRDDPYAGTIPQQGQTLVVSVISRIDANQKGLDILYEAMPEILKHDVRFILLGKGDKVYEEKFKALEAQYPEKVSVNIGFSEDMARKIYAGSDLFLMPSRTEPCGLAQMIAMRYGALPLVHETGGLKDTVSDGVDGFSFQIFTASELVKAFNRALKVYGSEKWAEMVGVAMKKDFSWGSSAREYVDLYEKVVGYKEARPK